MTAPNDAFCISSMAALRETNNLTMTKSQAEVVLSSFVAKGWLVKSRYVCCTLMQGHHVYMIVDAGATHSHYGPCWNSCRI